MAQEAPFSPEAAVEALLYVIQRLTRPTIHEVLKVRYAADKLHLERYGWLASGDSYVAMDWGPVASTTYDMLKLARGDSLKVLVSEDLQAMVEGAIEVGPDRKTVRALRPPKMDLLSAADIECLEEALATEGGLDFVTRTSRSHDDAWQAAYDGAVSRGYRAGSMSVESIAQTLPNSEELIAHLRSR